MLSPFDANTPITRELGIMITEQEKIRYSKALKGLKAQAKVVSEALPNSPDKNELVKAQGLMSEHDFECKIIYKLVMMKGVPIPDLSEEVLLAWLDEPVGAL